MNQIKRVLAAFVFVGALAVNLPALAQEAATPATPKWRPKPGIYAIPGKGFDDACGEFQDVILELGKKAVYGHEWNCKVIRQTDIGRGAIKLEMACDDYNLAGYLNQPEDKIFNETMLLKKIDEDRIIVRKTNNGKFTAREYRASYCPPHAQRAYIESEARSNAEAGQKAEREKLRLNPWRPQEGIYATPGATSDDRCLNAGDAIIELSERSISIGPDKCGVTFVRDEPGDAIKLFVTCGPGPNARGSIGKLADGASPAPQSPETIILKKIDDKTLSLQKSRSGTFTDNPVQQLSYCGPEVQKMHAQEKAAK